MSSGGRDFTKAHPLDFSLQSIRSSEFTRAVDRCFLFLEELVHIVRGTICVSQRLFQQGKQTVNCKLLLSNRRFQVQTVFGKCGSVLRFIFLNSNHWVGILGFRRSGKLRLFCKTHVRSVRPMQIECCAPWNGFRLVLVSKHIFQQCSSGPKSVDKVLQLVRVLCQNLPVWPRWKCWFVLRS